jgi:hypothetical protein
MFVLRAATALTVLLLLAKPAVAQETICDPENPACDTGEEPDTEETTESGDVETIFDPENPAAEEPADEPGPTLETEEEQPPDSGFQTARFLGEWGTRLDVDTSFDGEREDIVELSSRFDLGLEWEPRDDFRVVVGGEFRHWVGGKENPDETDLLVNASDVRASYDARLGEAYALWRWQRFSLAAGNLVTRWGSTDLVRPGDVLNPTDQTSFSAMEAPERLPQLTLDGTWSGPGWSFQALLVPFFKANRTWAFGRDNSLLTSRNPVIADQFPIDRLLDDVIDASIQDDIQPLASATRVPDETLLNASYGARGTVTFWNTDVGVGWWRGWDRTPFIFADEDLRTLLNTVLSDGQILEDFDFLAFFVRHPELVDVTDDLSARLAAGEDAFFSEYRRQQMFLVDAARYVGPIGVRTDVAFFTRKTYLTESFESVRRPTLSPALGLSWERFESEDDVVSVTVEGFANVPFAADSPVTESLVPEDQRGVPDDALLIVGDGVYGVSGSFLWTTPWIETTLQLGGVYNVSHGDLIASASVQRTFFEWLQVGAGYTLFAGPAPRERLTLGGIYDTNDHLSLAVSGVF